MHIDYVCVHMCECVLAVKVIAQSPGGIWGPRSLPISSSKTPR